MVGATFAPNLPRGIKRSLSPQQGPYWWEPGGSLPLEGWGLTLKEMEQWGKPDGTYDLTEMVGYGAFQPWELDKAFGAGAGEWAEYQTRANIGRVTSKYPSETYDLWQYLYGMEAPALDREYTSEEATQLAQSQKEYAGKVTEYVQRMNTGDPSQHQQIYPKLNAKYILAAYPEWSAEYQAAQSFLQRQNIPYDTPLKGEEFIKRYYPQWQKYWLNPIEIAKARAKARAISHRERSEELKSRAAKEALSPELYKEWKEAGGAKKKWGTLPTVLTSEERAAGREGKTAAEYAKWEEEANWVKWGELAVPSEEYRKAGIGTQEFYDYMEGELEPYKTETGGYDIWAAYQSGKFSDIQLEGIFGEEVAETLFQARKQAGYGGWEMRIPLEYAAPIPSAEVSMRAISEEQYERGKRREFPVGLSPAEMTSLESLIRIDDRRGLIKWAEERGIPNPEQFVRDILAGRTGEVSMRAISEEEEERAREGRVPPLSTSADYLLPNFIERMLTDPLAQRSLARDIQLYTKKEVVGVLGQSLTMLPPQMGATILQAMQGQGGASVANRGWADRYIQLANEDMERFAQEVAYDFPSIPLLRETARFSQNLAYSITSMGAGLAVGVPTAFLPFPGARYAAWVAGTAASGVVAYQMTTYQIMQQYLEMKDAEQREQTGRGITLEEENKLKADFHREAVKYGLYEAIPEALSNLAFAQFLGGPLGRMIGGGMATRITTKLAGIFGEELLTETITQKGQSGIEVRAGLREKNISWLEAFKEIAPQTFMLTTFMAGAGQVIISTSSAIRKAKTSLKKEIGAEHPLYDEINDKLDKHVTAKMSEAPQPEITGKLVPPKGIQVPIEGITPEAVKPTAVAAEITAPEVTPEPIASIIKRLTDTIKAAKPARAETELLKTAELARRIPRARKAALAAKPEEAAFAAMGQLKGELPKAQFVPPETVLAEGDIRALYEHLRSHLLIDGKDSFKWLNTDAALRTLLAGKIPTRGELALLEDAFGPELIEAILSKRPLSEKALENILDAMNVPRAILASGDLSAWLRQGAFIVTAHPKIGARALGADIKSLLSGKYAAELDQFIRTGKYASSREKAGLFLGPIEGAAARLSQREELFMSRLVKKIPFIGPWVKVSERAYVSTLNYMRATTYDSYAAKWEGQGYPLTVYKELATLINWATGRGPIGKLAPMTPALNAVLFATRLLTSRAAMGFGGYKFTSPPVRKAYARMMVSFFGTMGGIVALGALVGLWETEKDPRSSDFGKIRIGNTRLDPWAGFQPIARLIAQLITGLRLTATGRVQDISRMETLVRFFRSKASPVFGLAWDLVKGETFIGEALTLEAEGVGEQVYQRLTPLFIQDLIDAIKEEGWLGGFIALPGILGVGVVSYPGSIDAYERHVRDIPEDMLLDWQKAIPMGGGQLTYQNLNVLQRAWLRRYCESIDDMPERREAGQYNFYEAQSEVYEEFEALLSGEIQPVVEAYSAGRISLNDYIEQVEYLRDKYFGQASTAWLDAMRLRLDPLLHKNLERWHEEEIKPEDVAYERYMELRANPPKAHGVPDWDLWERTLTKFMDGQSEEVRNYIEQRRIDWINKLSPERQAIERLILDCESVLDAYYAVEPTEAMTEKYTEAVALTRARAEYRDLHPEVDARLIILRGFKPRSGLQEAHDLLRQYGISILPDSEQELETWLAEQPLKKVKEGWTDYIEAHYDIIPKVLAGSARRYKARDNDPYLDVILFITGRVSVLRKTGLDEKEQHVLRLMYEFDIKPEDISAFANNMPKYFKMKNKWPEVVAQQETPQKAPQEARYWWEK